MHKSIDQINQRIRDGTVHVVTAEEMPSIVAELGEEGALKEVDVVTTGTFGAMCSSGAFFNFGHAEPPIRMERIWLNNVEAYGASTLFSQILSILIGGSACPKLKNAPDEHIAPKVPVVTTSTSFKAPSSPSSATIDGISSAVTTCTVPSRIRWLI